jgi:hypothetical protein
LHTSQLFGVRKVFRFLLMGCIFLSSNLSGQDFSFKLHSGSFLYQGDLAPTPLKVSFGPASLAYGFSAEYGLSKYVGLGAKFMHGQITGDDKFATEEARKTRNLNFRSFVNEASVFTDIKMNAIFPSIDKYKIYWSVNIGGGMMFFDPKTIYQGQIIRLQPLGTEGQFLEESQINPYKLYTFVRPIGSTVEFAFNSKIRAGLELRAVKTYTDYLDDVSSSYPDYYRMYESGNELGAFLTERSGELTGSLLPTNKGGQTRGNSDKKDWYTHIGLYVEYTFGKGISK